MPAPSPAAAAALPEDLDALVRQALSGGRVDKVRKALEGRVVPAPEAPAIPVPPVPPAPAPAWTAPPSSVPAPRPSPAPRAPAAAVAVAPAALSPGEMDRVFDALAATAARARGAWRSGDEAAVARTLSELSATLDEARSLLGGVGSPAHPVPVAALEPVADLASIDDLAPLDDLAPEDAAPLVELPRYRHPWLLVVEGAGDANKARLLAEAMDVDLSTAQHVALSPYPRVALRAEERLHLDRKAGRVQAIAGLRAAVVSRESLVEMGVPCTVLGASGVRRFEVTDQPAWRADGPPADGGAGLLCDTSGVVLAVPGDVVVRKYRVGIELGRTKGRTVKVAGERRVAVVDLHGPDCFVRVVQGVTDLKGLPGHDQQSTLRSMRGLVDKIWQWWPQAAALSPRTARPGDMPSLEEVSAEPDGLERAGWAEWEEHTRMARLLAGLA